MLFIGMCICAILGMTGRTSTSLLHSLVAILGVRKAVWGYPTPNPDNGVETYYSNVKFEAQVSLITKSCI